MKVLLAVLFLAVAVSAEPKCPTEQESDWSIEQLLRHEDCNMFYKCTYGQPVEQQCFGDLYFNLDTWQCDWPENVDCEGRNVPDVTNPTPEPETEPTAEPEVETEATTEPEVETEETTVPEVETEATSKPEVEAVPTAEPEVETEATPEPEVETEETTVPEVGTEATSKPEVETEATTQPEIETEATAEPEVITEATPKPEVATNATAVPEVVTEATPKPDVATNATAVPEVVTEATPEPEVITEPSVESEPENPDFLENGCPVDPHVHLLLPHETECNLFYYCVWGEKVLRECSGPLHFNRVLQVCDWPADAGCTVSANKHYGSRMAYLNML